MSKHRYPKIYSNGLLIIFWLKSQFWGQMFLAGTSMAGMAWYWTFFVCDIVISSIISILCPKNIVQKSWGWGHRVACFFTAAQTFGVRKTHWALRQVGPGPSCLPGPKTQLQNLWEEKDFKMSKQNPKLSSDHLTEHPRPSFYQPITNIFNIFT